MELVYTSDYDSPLRMSLDDTSSDSDISDSPLQMLLDENDTSSDSGSSDLYTPKIKLYATKSNNSLASSATLTPSPNNSVGLISGSSYNSDDIFICGDVGAKLEVDLRNVDFFRHPRKVHIHHIRTSPNPIFNLQNIYAKSPSGIYSSVPSQIINDPGRKLVFTSI